MDNTFYVKSNERGQRLDQWLQSKMRSYSRSQIKNLLDDGRILINRKRVLIAGWELEDGDTVEVRVPPNFGAPREDHTPKRADRPAHEDHKPRPHQDNYNKSISSSLDRHIHRHSHAQKRPEPSGEPHKHVHLKVYHEDRDLIVVEKPAGIISVPSGGDYKNKESLLGHVRDYLMRKHKGARGVFVAPLHRLDTETSGIMVFALSKLGQRLEEQFKRHQINREYTALVVGRVENNEGVIDIPLKKGDFGFGKKVAVAPDGDGMKAVTEYRVEERYGKATLLKVRLRTGRTHQIRVHLAEKGYPIVGDKLYTDGHQLHFARQVLHANLLGFKHPATGKKCSYHSQLPKDIRALIDSLRMGA